MLNLVTLFGSTFTRALKCVHCVLRSDFFEIHERFSASTQPITSCKCRSQEFRMCISKLESFVFLVCWTTTASRKSCRRVKLRNDRTNEQRIHRFQSRYFSFSARSAHSVVPFVALRSQKAAWNFRTCPWLSI